jgi:succinyl-CoA synthetase beta subunit
VKIHEYQAKAILREFGVPVPNGRVADTPAQARAIAEELGGKVVVKAQIHAGGRGKGGGVKLANSPEEAEQAASAIIGMQLITPQTGPEGKRVKSVLVDEQTEIARELYLSILVDGSTAQPLMMVSASGGMDIEQVAEQNPEAIERIAIDPAEGFQPYMGRRAAYALGLSGDLAKQAVPMFQNLYRAFVAKDCSLLEINPLVVTKDDRVIALDAKVNFDDNAMFRHPDVKALRDIDEEDPLEVKAESLGINNYIKLDGNIACIVNGAGLAMATLDVIKHAGGEPANFLDIGTANNTDLIVNSFRVIGEDQAVKAVLVNIFGGMARVDVIAQGIIQSFDEGLVRVPVVARLAGTNVEQAEEILANTTHAIRRAKDLGEAGAMAVAAASGS